MMHSFELMLVVLPNKNLFIN